MGRSIAIVGTSPTSRDRAPFFTDWEIWMCGPGNLKMPDFHRWYEVHPPNNDYDGCADRLIEAGDKLWTCHRWDIFPKARALDREKIGKPFGPWVNAFLTSSMAHMWAHALCEHDAGKEIEEVGMWGIDLSHATEYERQRPGMYFFMTEAWKRGIKTSIAKGSPLNKPIQPYPLNFETDEAKWFDVRLNLQRQKLRQVTEQRHQAELAEAEAKGFLSAWEHAQNSWG